MDSKGGRTTAITAEEVRAALTQTQTLSPVEEQVLRMRYGAKVSTTTRSPLPSAAGDNESLADELLVMEMQLLRAMRARQATPRAVAGPSPRNAAKDKIVRALRKKR